MTTETPLPRWVRAVVVATTFLALCWLERRTPLRPHHVEPPARRFGRNMVIAAGSAATVQALEAPAVMPLAALVEQRRWGLLKRWRLPAWVEVPLAVALLDYTLFLWHVLVHKVPFLWRFHQPHHVDLDMDASTALRFHFGEIALSVPWRAVQVVAIGAGPLSLSAWQTATLAGIMFHHSNVRLSPRTEAWLSRLVVTPRLHEIHHSIVREETDSNWSSGLAVWDWLHGTLRRDVPTEAITIGVPAYRDPADVTLPRVVAMPFGSQRPTWQLGPGPDEA